MKMINLDDKWTFRRGYLDSVGMLSEDPGTVVNLPHDGMIGTPVTPDAPAKSDSGYFVGGLTNYTKFVMIPEEWRNDCVGLLFDGAMMSATIDINGGRVGLRINGKEVKLKGGCLHHDNGLLDAAIPLRVKVEGCGVLAGFGSANPVTDEDYTDEKTVSYRGRTMAILRSGYESGEIGQFFLLATRSC